MAIPKHHLVADMPTNSFATLNPLSASSNLTAEGNLVGTSTDGSNWQGVYSNMHVSTGKWYFEVIIESFGDIHRGMFGVLADPSKATVIYNGNDYSDDPALGATGGTALHTIKMSWSNYHLSLIHI